MMTQKELCIKPYGFLVVFVVLSIKLPHMLEWCRVLASFGFLLASNRLTLLQAGVLPQSLQSLDGIPNGFRYGLTALASERIPNRMSTSRCVMTTLHLGRDDRGKENAVSPPFRTVSRFELEIGTSLLVWSA